MVNKKTVFKYFTILQYQQEEEYLSSMHEKGWKLERITFPGLYHFERCEPGKVTYRLDYNQEGIKNKTEYVQMFSDCGWNYLFDFVGYSYFCKEGSAGQEREEIFCDDLSRFDMMKRVFKGRIIPLIILFISIVLPQLFINTLGHNGGGTVQDVLSILFMLIAILYLVIFGVTAYQFYQYENKLFQKKPSIKYKYYGIFILILLIVICIGIFFYFTKRSVYSVLERTDGFTVEAEQLNKSVVREYNLKQGDIVETRHDYDSGSLFISIGEEDKEPVFYGNSYNGMGNFTVEIKKDGCYRIKCSGRNAKGVIKFVIK